MHVCVLPCTDHTDTELDGSDDVWAGDQHSGRGAGEGVLRDPYWGMTNIFYYFYNWQLQKCYNSYNKCLNGKL